MQILSTHYIYQYIKKNGPIFMTSPYWWRCGTKRVVLFISKKNPNIVSIYYMPNNIIDCEFSQLEYSIIRDDIKELIGDNYESMA